MNAEIKTYLGDIVDWSARASRYVEKHTFETFVADTMVFDAVVRCIEVIGEASSRIKRIDPNFQSQHPELELAEAKRMRNVLSHVYGELDEVVVWQAVTESLPRQRLKIEGFLKANS